MANVHTILERPQQTREAGRQRLVPFAKPWMGQAEMDAVCRPIASGWIGQGPEVATFEGEFAEFVGAEHACAVSNCSAALHLALLAVGTVAGDEVVTVSHSFVATAAAILHCGATPVFVDIEPTSLNMNMGQVEAAITPRTRAVVCVHQLGMPCDLKAIAETCRKHGLALVEDAACAVGSEILWNGRWERIGRPHGDVACFSFHPRKLIATGEGGMLTTSSAQLARTMRLQRQHGMSVSDSARHKSRKVVFEEYPLLGFNYRMTDLQAAIGRCQLRRLPEMIDRRHALGRRYGELLAGVPGLGLAEEASWARNNWQSYSVRLPEDCDQVGVMQYMLDRGVATRRGVMCAHLEAGLAGRGRWTDLCKSEDAQTKCILLPMYHELTDADQQYVAEVLGEACERR